MSTTTYRQLNAEKTISTLQVLRNRIQERFGESSLAGVAAELCDIAGESRKRIEWIERPQTGLRAIVAVVIFLSISVVGYGASELFHEREERLGAADAIGVVESALNEVIIIGAALLFLFSLEARIKRTRSLQVLHDLRAMAHVIDMHQLTKDPSQILHAGATQTKSSPKRVLTPFQLVRYLHYCSELLALIGKLAALYAQSLPDAVVVGAVNDIETLTTGLSRKIWQKIVIIDSSATLIASDRPAGSLAPAKPDSQAETPGPGKLGA